MTHIVFILFSLHSLNDQQNAYPSPLRDNQVVNGALYEDTPAEHSSAPR